MELTFHMYLLSFEGINFVAHTHPTNTLKVLCGNYSNLFANNRLFPDQVVFNGVKSCLVPYSTPGYELTLNIQKNVQSFIDEEGYLPKLILLENHGIITLGKSVDECVIATDICEKSAEIFNENKSYSKFLSIDKIIDLINNDQEKYRQNQLK
jgi:rhamnose utilization protein RhaD (predicted bifunctional aldolase and dehydrogenase)